MASFRLTRLVQTLKANWFWCALIIVVAFGYIYGTDRAERDNARQAHAQDVR